jgi:hypothetical protein
MSRRSAPERLDAACRSARAASRRANSSATGHIAKGIANCRVGPSPTSGSPAGSATASHWSE